MAYQAILRENFQEVNDNIFFLQGQYLYYQAMFKRELQRNGLETIGYYSICTKSVLSDRDRSGEEY